MRIIHRSRNQKLIYPLFFLVIGLFLFLNCQSIEDKWKEAKQKNTIEDYQQFLKNNPDSKFDAIAKLKIDSLRFEFVKDTNTIKSFKRFLKLYPNSSYYQNAQDSVISLKFKKIITYSSIDSLRKFFKQYSEYPLAAKADSIIIQLFDLKIQKAKTYKEKDRIENKIIADILKNGKGTRFIIPELLPPNKINTESFSFNIDSEGNIQRNKSDHIESISIDGMNSVLKTLYPKDGLSVNFSHGVVNLIVPDSHCGIYRFIRKVKFTKEFTFIGNKKNAPLTFMFLDEEGFVYLHGYGQVLKNNKVIRSF